MFKNHYINYSLGALEKWGVEIYNRIFILDFNRKSKKYRWVFLYSFVGGGYSY